MGYGKVWLYTRNKLTIFTLKLLASIVVCLLIYPLTPLFRPEAMLDTNKPFIIGSSDSTKTLLNITGASLISSHYEDKEGNWSWESSIQSPHFQTDRDVGASGIGMGLIALYQTTKDKRYLYAAEKTGDWLLEVAEPVQNGYRWPDYSDPNGDISTDHYTSFDDGAAGISDYLWQLGDISGNAKYKVAALKGMSWEEDQAQNVGDDLCPSSMCKWQWEDSNSGYKSGMGEGMSGIVYEFESFYLRTGDETYQKYAKAGAAFLESIVTSTGAIPENIYDTSYDTGFLSGSAGDAFVFMYMYKATGNLTYLQYSKRLLDWVYSVKSVDANGYTWPIMIDPINGDDNTKATGIEEGNAGIGWVYLQAYELTHNAAYLDIAKKSGDWLLANEYSQNGFVNWPEDQNARLVHVGLNNGASGIGWFLFDLYKQTKDDSYLYAANSTCNWLNSVKVFSDGYYWDESEILTNKPTWQIMKEPSWHWGSAGIAAYAARLSGWQVDSPGEEPGF